MNLPKVSQVIRAELGLGQDSPCEQVPFAFVPLKPTSSTTFSVVSMNQKKKVYRADLLNYKDIQGYRILLSVWTEEKLSQSYFDEEFEFTKLMWDLMSCGYKTLFFQIKISQSNVKILLIFKKGYVRYRHVKVGKTNFQFTTDLSSSFFFTWGYLIFNWSFLIN